MSMTSLSRISDIGEGTCPEHGDYTTTFVTGASTVFVNNQAQAIIGTIGDQSCHPDHDSKALTGSPTVFVENMAIHRQGDTGAGALDDVYISLTGSPDVFNDGAVGGGGSTDTSEGVDALPAEFSVANTEKVRLAAGRFAPLDDPPSIGATPAGYSRDLKAPPVGAGTSVPAVTTPAGTPVQGDCGGSEIPDYNLALSPNFTLNNYSKGALFSHAIQAQAGFSVSQIVCNLKSLSVEVVERVRTQYPGLRINSGFRTVTSGKSQHEKGQACDIQWAGISPAEYLERAKWIVDNIVFDQFIFEHGNSIWLHVSFNRNAASQKKQVLTMINGSYQPGLKLYY